MYPTYVTPCQAQLCSVVCVCVFLDWCTATYMRLEDITSKFRKPCVMDLKLGRRVWDDSASQDKIDREMKKYPIQETVGFRIIGMRVRD